jgi:hypothetical protein
MKKKPFYNIKFKVSENTQQHSVQKLERKKISEFHKFRNISKAFSIEGRGNKM